MITLYKRGYHILVVILQSVKSRFSGSDFNDFFYIIYKDLAIANVSCVQSLFGSADYFCNRNGTDDYFYLDVYKRQRISLSSSTASELVVNTAGFVTLCTNDLQST